MAGDTITVRAGELRRTKEGARYRAKQPMRGVVDGVEVDGFLCLRAPGYDFRWISVSSWLGMEVEQ